MPRGLAAFAWLLMMFGTPRAHGTGTIVELSYPASEKPGELCYGVTYRVWIPAGVKRLRGVIVHQHGCGSGACKAGETAADDLHWQALARKWDCALLGPSYKQEDGQDCRRWCDPRRGSRARFLQALDDLAGRSGHPELATVPWCLWGHSGGAFWTSLMMASDPDRIVAAWLRSGTAFAVWEKGEIPKPEIPEAAYRIPVMCNPGAKERDDARFKGAWDGTLAMFRSYRAKGAPIGFAPDPRTKHECGDSRYLAIPFFDACLAARLPGEGADSAGLKPVSPARAWLAPVLGQDAVPASAYRGEATEAVWLPDERVARAWMEYVRTGAVGDATPPPAPTGVKIAARSEGGIEVTWSAEGDLESGLRQFVIRRDGQEIGRVPGQPVGRFGRPLFQAMSYHDTPEKPLPAMRFIDAIEAVGKASRYRVIAINGIGMESEPSQEVQGP
jgi:hypothetical protein